MNARTIECAMAAIVAWEGLLAVALYLRLRASVRADSYVPDAVARIVSGFNAPRAETIDEIHQRYAELAETDPKLASELKYGDALALHGK
jgi:hypothetical protein